MVAAEGRVSRTLYPNVIKFSCLNIEKRHSTRMGADIKFISLGVVYNVFEVVMRNTVTGSTHHIVGQFARSAVHSVQSAALGTYP